MKALKVLQIVQIVRPYRPPPEDVIIGEDLKRFVSTSTPKEEELLVQLQKPRVFFRLSSNTRKYLSLGIIGAAAVIFLLTLVFAYGVIVHDTVYIVVSESMIPNLNVGDLLIIRHGDSSSLFHSL